MNRFYTAMFLCFIGVCANGLEIKEHPIKCHLRWEFVSGLDDRITMTKTVRSPDWIVEGMVLIDLSTEFSKVATVKTDVERATQMIVIKPSRLLSKDFRSSVVEKMKESGWVVEQ